MNMKGTLPLLILRTLAAGPLHGYGIAKAIKGKSQGVLDFREGTLYPALYSLEAKGMIASTRKKGNGRTRCYYRLTEAGHEALADEKTEWERFAKAVEAVMGET